jgi:hypothetical protein
MERTTRRFTAMNKTIRFTQPAKPCDIKRILLEIDLKWSSSVQESRGYS